MFKNNLTLKKKKKKRNLSKSLHHFIITLLKNTNFFKFQASVKYIRGCIILYTVILWGMEKDTGFTITMLQTQEPQAVEMLCDRTHLLFVNVSSVLFGALVKICNLALREGKRKQPLTSLTPVSKFWFVKRPY